MMDALDVEVDATLEMNELQDGLTGFDTANG